MKNKLLKFIKKNKWLILTFLISSFIMSLIYTFNKIAPFGNNSMLDVDFYHQYGPLLNELHDRVLQKESLLFSFNTGMGIPFYRNFLNYLSSPFNIILFLFKKEHIVMAFSFIIALKAITASCTMNYFLSNKFKTNNILTVGFSLLYAFSGYFCSYYWNIMWLDGMVFLPLIVLGITKLIDEEKPMFYIISLAVMLFSNYFIGYMICIFSVIYFLGYFIYKGNFNKKNILKKFIMFFTSSLLAGGLVAFMLIPLYYSLSSISATKDSFPSFEFNFNILDYMFNHLQGSNRTVFASDSLPLPNVFCGMLTLSSILMLFINKDIKLKTKIFSIIALIMFFLFFNINILDFMWHAFHVPNDLPWRYSFIYVFILITIGYYSMLKIKTMDNFKVTIVFMVMFVFSMLSQKLEFINLDANKTLICLLILLLYYLVYLGLNIKKVPKIIFGLIFIFIVSFECIYGITSNWKIDHDIKDFMFSKKYIEDLVKHAKDTNLGLYRMEKNDYLTLNDGAWYDYRGINTFTSMAYEDVSIFQRDFGMAGNDINSYYYKELQTPIYNTAFNVNYVMGDYINDNYFELDYNNEDYNLNKFKYPTSIVYMTDKYLKDWKLVDGEPFINQNNFVVLSTGNNNIFKPLQVKSISGASIYEEEFYNNSNGFFTYELEENSSSINLTLANDENRSIYLYISGRDVTGYYVDEKYYSITSDEYFITGLGNKENDINIEIKVDKNTFGDLKLYAYYIDDNVFNDYYNYLKDGLLDISYYDDTTIIGEITAKNNQIAFTTIPYDKGWNVYVDGKKVETMKIANAYLAFELEEGKHNIKLKYSPYLMNFGIFISILSLGTLIIYRFYKRKRKKYQKR